MGPVDHEPEELRELDAAGWNREDLAEFGADGRVDFRGRARLRRLSHARLRRVVILLRRGGHGRRADWTLQDYRGVTKRRQSGPHVPARTEAGTWTTAARYFLSVRMKLTISQRCFSGSEPQGGIAPRPFEIFQKISPSACFCTFSEVQSAGFVGSAAAAGPSPL